MSDLKDEITIKLTKWKIKNQENFPHSRYFFLDDFNLVIGHSLFVKGRNFQSVR